MPKTQRPEKRRRINVMLDERDIELADRMSEQDGHNNRSALVRKAIRVLARYRDRAARKPQPAR